MFIKKINPFINKGLSPTMDWIVYDDSEVVRQKCVDITLPVSKEDRKEIEKMVSYIDACYRDEHEKFNIRAGVAIASIQIGFLKKVIYLHFDDEDGNERHWLLANPKITASAYDKSYIEYGEGCLSVENDHDGIVPRCQWVELEAYDLMEEKDIKISANGYTAIVLQHEMDHLSGVLYYDRINIFNPHFVDEKWEKIK